MISSCVGGVLGESCGVLADLSGFAVIFPATYFTMPSKSQTTALALEGNSIIEQMIAARIGILLAIVNSFVDE